jgi:hypothetical protein
MGGGGGVQALALDFLGVPAADTARRERRGLYSAATFGPPGKRLRVILLVSGRGVLVGRSGEACASSCSVRNSQVAAHAGMGRTRGGTVSRSAATATCWARSRRRG